MSYMYGLLPGPSQSSMRVLIFIFSHIFCWLCIQEWGANTIRKDLCTVCKKEIGDRELEKDLIATNIIGDLLVICNYSGCHWRGREAELRGHLHNCDHRPRKHISSRAVIEVIEDESEV